MEAKVFLTDYNSYNEGDQFKFGHWVDLTEFSGVEEFKDYLDNHFKNVVGLEDYEPMYTDFEGFDESLYSESMSDTDLEKIFQYIEIGYEDKDDSEKIALWNEYCSEQHNEDEIYDFDDDFFDTHFEGRPMEAARATAFGDVNWSDNYIKLNGYGNLESMNDTQAIGSIDEGALIEWLIDNL